VGTRLYAFLEKNFFALLCAGLCVIFIARYLITAIQRAAFPFALEWVEGNSFLHVLRALQGEAIYAPPTYDFIPMIYPPLYYYAAAPLAGWTGNIFLSMRVVSILASLLAFAALYGLGRARGLAKSSSFLAVGLFAAAYGLTGFWLDLGRVDSLFMALLLGAAWMATDTPTRSWPSWRSQLRQLLLPLNGGGEFFSLTCAPLARQCCSLRRWRPSSRR
jgi:4-amino-4-deoxy-L-arabinose transferase-like glycosyltransferase